MALFLVLTLLPFTYSHVLIPNLTCNHAHFWRKKRHFQCWEVVVLIFFCCSFVMISIYRLSSISKPTDNSYEICNLGHVDWAYTLFLGKSLFTKVYFWPSLNISFFEVNPLDKPLLGISYQHSEVIAPVWWPSQGKVLSSRGRESTPTLELRLNSSVLNSETDQWSVTMCVYCFKGAAF